MKNKKMFAALAGIFFVLLTLVSCQDPNNTLDGVKLVNYSFRLSTLPYSSQKLKVIARTNLRTKHYDFELGELDNSPVDTVIEKTVKMPILFDSINIFFLDKDGTEIFYSPVEKRYNKNAARSYKIDGNFYYYYEYGDPSYNEPYYALSQKYLTAVEYNKAYNFDTAENPYLLFKLSGVLNNKIGIRINQSYHETVEIYVADSKANLFNYQVEALNGKREYDCPADEAYFMVKTKKYTEEGSATITFSNISFARENGIEMKSFDVKVLASDGKLYVTGDTYSENSYEKARDFLYCIDPATGVRSQVADLGSRIWCVEELDSGTLYIAADDKTIKKYNLSTGLLSDFVSGLTIYVHSMVNYKDNKFAATGRTGTNDYSGDYFILIDKNSGTQTVLNTTQSEIGLARELSYSPENDLFIGRKEAGTPRYLEYLKITNDSFITKGGLFDITNGPIKIFKSSPLQIIAPSGKVYTINTDNLNSESWAKDEGVSGRSFTDCYILGNYIYYMKNEKDVVVEKCALSAPETVISSQQFEGKTGKKLFYKDNKLYLLSSSSNTIGGSYCYLTYLDQLTF